MKALTTAVFLVSAPAALLFAQGVAPVRLNLQEAAALALKNHPQVQAARDVFSAMTQRITEARAAYYPDFNADITGSQANPRARIGAGFLTTSSMFNRIGVGFSLNQMISDWGRTPNLVAEARLRTQATQQDYQATRDDVLLGVNRAYFLTLRAQALIKVARETVAARQLLVDQVTALARNNLRSQLDVSFVGVNLAQARLLLIQSQNEVQAAYAELTRALGQEQPAAYELMEQPLPPILAGAKLKGENFRYPWQVHVYQQAAQVGNVLYQLPCNCRCDRALGHTSLRSCYEGLHGTECSTCAKEAFYAYRLTK